MTQSVRRQDRIVEDYLAAVAHACAGLSAVRRKEVLNDLSEHIAVARAALADPSEAGIRTILDRLGEPAAIAAEASVGELVRSPAPRRQAASPVIVVAILVFVAFIVMVAAGFAALVFVNP